MNATIESNSTPKGVRNIAGRFLTFSMAEEFCGLAALKVREIIELVTITPVRRSAATAVATETPMPRRHWPLWNIGVVTSRCRAVSRIFDQGTRR
jgi:hypothetical protein